MKQKIRNLASVVVVGFGVLIQSDIIVSASSEGMVRFVVPNCGLNQNIYPSSSSNSVQTYINACYVDDATYLDQTETRYKVFVGGVEGWVKKDEGNGAKAIFVSSGDTRTVPYAIQEEDEVYEELENILDPIKVPEMMKEALESNESLFSIVSTRSEKTLTVRAPSYYKKNSSGDLVHFITKDVSVTDYSVPTYSVVTVGKAPSWMNTEVRYYSQDGIYFYTNWRDIQVSGEGSSNKSNPFYNYYQYLPLRSKTNLTEADFNKFLSSKGYTKAITSDDLAKVKKGEEWLCNYESGKWYYNGTKNKCLDDNKSLLVGTFDSFRRSEDVKGVNALVEAVWALHESGYGRSKIAIAKNNLFGMGAYDSCAYDCAESYPTVSDGLNAHINKYIAGYLNHSDWRYFGSHLGNKASGMNVKYASDPFWGEKIAGQYYAIDKVAGLKDYDYYTIGVKQSDTTYNVYKQANSGNGSYYQTKNSAYTIKHYPVIITGESNGFYEVKTDTPISAGGSTSYLDNYVWSRNYGYIESKAISTVNHRKFIDPQDSPVPTQLTSKATVSNGSLTLSGYAYIKGIENTASNDIIQQLNFVNTKTGKSAKTVKLENYYSTSLTQSSTHGNGKKRYDYANFKSTIDVSNLPIGTYDLKLSLDGRGATYELPLKMATSFSKVTFEKNGKLFLLERVLVDKVSSLRLSVYQDEALNGSKTSYVKKINTFELDGTQIRYSGYSYIKGINTLESHNLIRKLKVVDYRVGSTIMNFDLENQYSKSLTNNSSHGAGTYNYDWAKFEGVLDLNTLPIGDYKLKLYTNAKGNKFEEVIVFNSQVEGFEYKTKEKIFTFKREGSTLRLTVTPLVGELKPMNNMKDFRVENGRLYVEGYSYIRGVEIPNSKDIYKRLKFSDYQTGGMVKTYDLTNVKSTSLSNSAEHGEGVFNYDWAKFKETIDLDTLPVGEYFMKIYTVSKGARSDEVIKFQSTLKDFSFETPDKRFTFTRVRRFNVSTFKVTVELIELFREAAAPISEEVNSPEVVDDILEELVQEEDVVVSDSDVITSEEMDERPEADGLSGVEPVEPEVSNDEEAEIVFEPEESALEDKASN